MAKKKQAEEKPNTQAAAAETETETTPPQAEENNQTQTDDPTAALEKELADTKDQLLRLTAEYANFRKRSDKEKGDSRCLTIWSGRWAPPSRTLRACKRACK